MIRSPSGNRQKPATVLDPIDLLAAGAVRAAPRLLGWRLSFGDFSGVIAETEAYASERDLACHASKGITARTRTLYAAPGTLYVYLCYGMHWMLNLVCRKEGRPAAVLIRGLLIDGIEARRSNGPGKITGLLGIDRRHDGLRLGASDCPLRLAPPRNGSPRRRRGERVGVDYAGPYWAHRPWRWWISGFPAVGTRSIPGQQT